MTYRKLALIAGVSLATVSKALSGSKEISRQTRERILMLAKEHGVIRPNYHKNIDVTRVAIIVPEIISVYYSKCVQALTTFLVKEGVEPSIHFFDFDSERYYQIIDSLVSQKLVDGILTFDNGNVSEYQGLPIVSFSNSQDADYDVIYADLKSGIYEAVSYLYSLGHREIGFIGEKAKNHVKFDMFNGAMARFGLTVHPKNVFFSEKRFEEIGYEAAEYFTKKQTLPTAFLTGYDEIALGAIRAFNDRGIRVPEDVSIVGINDIPIASYAIKPLTTINTFNSEIFRLGVKNLLDKIKNPQTHLATRTSIRCEFVIRETTDAPRKNKEFFIK